MVRVSWELLRFPIISRFSPTSQGIPLLKGTMLRGTPPGSLGRTPEWSPQTSPKSLSVHEQVNGLLIIFWRLIVVNMSKHGCRISGQTNEEHAD